MSISFGVSGFIGLRLGVRRDRSGSLGSWGYALVYVEFVRVRCVRWDTPWGMSGSFGVAGFIGVRLGGRQDRLGSKCSFGCAPGIVVSFVVSVFIVVRPGGRRVRSWTLRNALRVVGLVRCRWFYWGAPWGSTGSLGYALGVVGFV